mmetsp:Transcript_46316/g.110243  ORF Transcript_46316/g.110243 Transcript_46316/m.110243 type:complete len:255 (-) Transcript_46316:2629-3393(-)
MESLHRQAHAPLAVTLPGKLLHDHASPLAARLPGSHWIRYVRKVEEEIPQLPRHLRPNKDVQDFWRGELWLVAHCILVLLVDSVEEFLRALVDELQLLDSCKVRMGICVENGFHNSVPQVSVVVPLQPSEDVLVVISSNLKERRAMHVLQWRMIIVANRQIMVGFNQERIVDARMPHIMSQRSYHEGKQVPRYQVGSRVAALQQSKDHAGNVHAMQEVVVRHLITTLVPLLQLHHEVAIAQGEVMSVVTAIGEE